MCNERCNESFTCCNVLLVLRCVLRRCSWPILDAVPDGLVDH